MKLMPAMIATVLFFSISPHKASASMGDEIVCTSIDKKTVNKYILNVSERRMQSITDTFFYGFISEIDIKEDKLFLIANPEMQRFLGRKNDEIALMNSHPAYIDRSNGKFNLYNIQKKEYVPVYNCEKTNVVSFVDPPKTGNSYSTTCKQVSLKSGASGGIFSNYELYYEGTGINYELTFYFDAQNKKVSARHSAATTSAYKSKGFSDEGVTATGFIHGANGCIIKMGNFRDNYRLNAKEIYYNSCNNSIWESDGPFRYSAIYGFCKETEHKF